MNIEVENTKRRRTKIRLPFTHEEDQKLLEIIKNSNSKNIEKSKDCGEDDFINWKQVSKEMGNRSVRQCKERYLHYLSPSINKDDWTSEEDSLLITSVARFGKRWKILEELFKKRTEIDIRNRFYVLQRRISKIARSNSIKNNLDMACSPNIILSVKEIYLDIFKTHNNKKKNNSVEQIDDNSEDSINLPDNSHNEYIIKNDESYFKTEKLSDFFNKISDISFDKYKSSANMKKLCSFFNGCVYDNFFINDTTFS